MSSNRKTNLVWWCSCGLHASHRCAPLRQSQPEVRKQVEMKDSSQRELQQKGTSQCICPIDKQDYHRSQQSVWEPLSRWKKTALAVVDPDWSTSRKSGRDE